MKRKYLDNIPLFFILILYPVIYHIDFFLPGITSEFISLILLIVWGNIVWARKNEFCFNGLDFLFLLFIVWYTGVNLFTGPSFHNRSVLQTANCLFLYFYFRNIRIKNRFFLLLFYAGLIQSVWSIMQIRDLLPSYHDLLKGSGTFFNPAILGLFLVLSALAGIALFDRKLKSGLKLLWAAGLILLLSCILISNSRASWIALMTGTSWLFLTGNTDSPVARLKQKWQKKSLLKRVVSLSLGGLIICSTLYGLYTIRTDSVQGRYLIWQVIGNKFMEAPWFGQGSLPALYMPAQACWFQANPDSVLTKVAGNNIYAFNEFLRIAFETGITGLILFISLITVGGFYALKGNKQARYGGGLLLAIICFGLFSYPFSIGLITMVTVITLAMISQNTVVQQHIVIKKNVYMRRGIAFLSCLVLIFAAGEYRQEKKADLLLLEARQNTAILTHPDMLYCYTHLQDNPDFMLCYGKNLCNQELYENALPVLEQACRLSPSSQMVCDLGKCYQFRRRYREAEKAYLQASFMTPAYILPQYYLFCLYQETREWEKAREKAKHILTMPVKIVNTTVLKSRARARNFLKEHSHSK